MSRKISILVLIIVIATKAYCQDCPALFEKGNMCYLPGERQASFCFKKDPEILLDSIPGVYHTKYTVSLDKGREAYTIHFYFYKALDSISIIYFNAASGKIISEELRFPEHSSIRMFKNYRANDTSITENDRLCTLFTILNIERPYVTLNQFQLPDNKNTYLTFTAVIPDKLILHQNETSAYFKWKDSTDLAKETELKRVVERTHMLDSMLKEMKDYEAVLIKKVIDSNEYLKLYSTAADASIIYTEEFKRKQAHLFTGFLKKIFPVEDLNSSIKLTFICNGEGRIDPSKTTIDSTGSSRIKWLEDSVKIYVLPIIDMIGYRTMSIYQAYPNLIFDFENKNRSTINYFNSASVDNSEYRKFIREKRPIIDSLDRYSVGKEIHLPTRYTYVINYKTTVVPAEWVYEIDSKKNEERIMSRKNNEYIPDELKTLFKKKIAKQGIGKYKIRICSVYLDDILIGQDIFPN